MSAFRSGYAAIVGRANVGKSTLLNRLLKEKVAAVSPHPQTTRTRILGILTRPDAQIVFFDTPGIHKPQYRLNERMVGAALGSLEDADVILFLVEATERPGAGDAFIMERLRGEKAPIILVLNKMDLIKKSSALPLLSGYASTGLFREMIPASALHGENLDRLLDVVVSFLPEGPGLYPDDQVTDQTERVLAAELIREKILNRTRQELPFAVAVAVENFKEQPGLRSISATIYVERDSQKAIVIGKGGLMLKAIGREARLEMEARFGSRVYLELWVKTKPDWRQDDQLLTELGY